MTHHEWTEQVMGYKATAPWGVWRGVDWSLECRGICLGGASTWSIPSVEDAKCLLDALDNAGTPTLGWAVRLAGYGYRLLAECVLEAPLHPEGGVVAAILRLYQSCLSALGSVERAASRAETLATKMLDQLMDGFIDEALATGAEIEIVEALCRDLDNWPGVWSPWIASVRQGLGRPERLTAVQCVL